MIISNDFTKAYNTLCINYGEYNVFYDFVKMCAITIYNSFAKNQELEQEYLHIINSYSKEEQKLFPKMFCELIMEFERQYKLNGPTDILGPIYEMENLKNAQLGQFFTPSHISNCISKITINEIENIEQQIEKNGFITLCEPTCGAGGLVLSFASTLQQNNINYQNSLLVEATDISDFCAYMTYIQFSLYGIPATVYCGDCLTKKMRFKMETPLFFLNYWKFRRFYTKDKHDTSENGKKSTEIKNVIESENQNLNLKEVIIKGNCQITLW
ncbi:MAG: N-6 DNA methylase [Clostridia bacterium]|jgi:hypothetical protein|nr:N-6 DNA methylase [Clostridia bacterium]